MIDLNLHAHIVCSLIKVAKTVWNRYIMRAAPIITSGTSQSAALCSSFDDHTGSNDSRRMTTNSKSSCSDDTILITHIDGRRFLNLEQRAERGLPSHIPKYDV